MTGKTHTVGLIVENLTWEFMSRICNGVMHAAFRDRVNVITLNFFAEQQRDRRQLPLLIDQLIEQRVDGIIISADLFRIPTTSVLAMWSHDIVPVLLCNTQSDTPLDRIMTDENRLAQLAVDYLLRLGHRHIAYCGYNPNLARNRAMYRTFQTRKLSLDLIIENAGNQWRPPLSMGNNIWIFSCKKRTPRRPSSALRIIWPRNCYSTPSDAGCGCPAT